MSKNYMIFILSLFMMIYIITIITLGIKYEKAIDQIDKQESKKEALQEENASLHDNVWTLNQELMKDNKE